MPLASNRTPALPPTGASDHPALPAADFESFATDRADDMSLLRLVGAVAAALIALAATGSLLA
ncbi:MAG TPA: hypothetical protein VFQ20_11960 [Burkholderiaceae bacterium]|nr:hypothetical protein [Burkholderiaceae bacterium]